MMQDKNIPKILVTGGGSGGHLNAAISVIKYWEKEHRDVFEKLVFVGGTRGMIGDKTPSLESRKIPELGVRFIGIRSGKFHRKISLTTIRLITGVAGGYRDAYKVLRAEKPDIVFSTGGYVTVPVVMVAKVLGIKVVIHEQTIVAGLANRINAKFADKVLVAFPNSKKYFSKAKVVVTGNPLQVSRFQTDLPENLDPKYKETLQAFSKSHRPFIFITGGGLGSHKINQWFMTNLDKLLAEYNVLIQTGENQVYDDYGKISKMILENKYSYRVYATKWFGDEIGFIYENADLIIGRPGANTVSEVLATNNRAIFIPIPWSSHNEQQLNAEYFLENQSGHIVSQTNIDKELFNSIEKVLSMPKKNTSNLVDRYADEKISREILSA